ncbi:MAG: hypothetical protein QM764_14650 [Chitinophagaceae bacterium]
MIKNNQLVVIYGDSGTGKTSLIKAKLFPELSRQYYIPIYIRFNYLSKVDPLVQLKESIFDELSSWDKQVPNFTSGMTLIEFAAQTSVLNGLVKPILFFDQFEELFTLGQKFINPRVLENFLQQISDLVEMRLPVASKMKDLVPAGLQDDEPYGVERFTENVLRFTIVISMRQDYLAQLDDLRFQIPSINSNRYRIKRFDQPKALRAVQEPAKEFSKLKNGEEVKEIISEETSLLVVKQLERLDTIRTSSIPQADSNTKKVTATIIEFLKRLVKKKHDNSMGNITDLIVPKNTEIDPTVLSLYCHQLYKKAKYDGSYLHQITSEQVKSSPAEEIIKNYYRESLVRTKTKIAIENCLITPDGRRVLIPLNDFLTAADLTENKLNDLISQTGIMRIYGSDEEREIELAHDQIAKQALISKKEREANRIVRNAAIIFITAVVAVVSGILATAYFVKQQKANYTVTDLRKKNETLGKENELLDQKGKIFQSEVEKSKSQLTSLTEENKNLEQKISANNEFLNTARVQINTLQLENSGWKNRWPKTRDSLVGALNKINTLNIEYSVLQRAYQAQSDSMQAYAARVSRLNTSLASVQKENTSLKTDLTSCEANKKNNLIKKDFPQQQQQQQQKQ